MQLMFGVVVAVLLTVGTFLQMKTSLSDFGDARRDVIDWWTAEDQLIDEAARWRPMRRRQVRRQVRAERTPEMHDQIKHARLVLLSWVLLFGAAAMTLLGALIDAAR